MSFSSADRAFYKGPIHKACRFSSISLCFRKSNYKYSVFLVMEKIVEQHNMNNLYPNLKAAYVKVIFFWKRYIFK